VTHLGAKLRYLHQLCNEDGSLMRAHRSLIALILVSLGGPLVAGAPVNLVTNPHFDHDLSGW